MNISTLRKIRDCRTAVNEKTDKVHRDIVRRKVNSWVSSENLTEQQIEEGLSFHELCIFLFMIKMSRGYEDERLILQVFLMFTNRSDDFGRFGVLSPEDERIASAKMSQADIRVFLMCT